MANNPNVIIQNLIHTAKGILSSYEETKKFLKSSVSKVVDIGIAELISGAAAELFESDYAGQRVRGLATSAIKQSKKNQLIELDTRTNASVKIWVSQVIECLRTSSSSAAVESVDSDRLVKRFQRTQRYVKPETKLCHGIDFLEALIESGLIANEDFKSKQESEKGFIAKGGERLEAYVRILQIIRAARDFVKIIDAYPGEDTLLALKVAPDGIPVRFLTRPPQNAEDRALFEAMIRKLMNDRSEIEVRYDKNYECHDRFILTHGNCWHVGQSIKDIGNKVTSLTLMSPQQATKSLEVFDSLWQKSKSLKE